MVKHFATFHPEHKKHVNNKLRSHNVSLSLGFIGLALIILGCFLSAIGDLIIGAVFIPVGLALFVVGLILTKRHIKKGKK